MFGPQVHTGRRLRKRIFGEEADIGTLERVRFEHATGGSTVKDEGDERDAGEPATLTVEDLSLIHI